MTTINGTRVSKRSRPMGIDSADAHLALSHHPDHNGNSHANGYNEHLHLQQSCYHPISPHHQISPTHYFHDVYHSESTHGLPPHYHIPSQQMIPDPFHQQFHQQDQTMVHGFPFSQRHPSQSSASIAAQGYSTMHATYDDSDIESQESKNEGIIKSEPIEPPLEGFPNVEEFDELMESYVADLSIKKQDKALIHARRARNIKNVLLDHKDTTIESAQFRFWVKKMFTLEAANDSVPMHERRVCHEGKPVAVREKLFKILTHAHQQCQHGGRDKTSGQVRRKYSWVPKELISRFVKICPTCQTRRGGASRLATPPQSAQNSPPPEDTPIQSPLLISPPESRRESMIHRHHPARTSLQHQQPLQSPTASIMPAGHYQQPQQSFMIDAAAAAAAAQQQQQQQAHTRAAAIAAQNIILNPMAGHGHGHAGYSSGGGGIPHAHASNSMSHGHPVPAVHDLGIEEEEFHKTFGGDYVHHPHHPHHPHAHHGNAYATGHPY